MARKKKTDRPKHVSIHFEHLLFDLDFMSNEYAGIILKMIVWYSAGTDECMEKIKQMKEYISTLPEKGWLTGMYQRVFASIDEDLDKYAEKCEKQRKRIQDYWDKKNSEEEKPRNTTEYDGKPRNTNEYQYDTIRTDTKRNELSKDNNDNNNSSSSSSSPNVRVREGGGSYIDSQINFWQNADIVTKKEIPELTEIWIEEIKHLALRFAKQELTDEDVHRHYEDFKAQEVTEILQTTYSDWRKHFGNYVRAALKREKNGNGQKYISRDEQRKQEAAAREQNAANLVKKLLSRNKAAG